MAPKRKAKIHPKDAALLPKIVDSDELDDPLSTGLSSWEEFLGISNESDQPDENPELPSIHELFSPDNGKSQLLGSAPSVSGAIPVSDLFYIPTEKDKQEAQRLDDSEDDGPLDDDDDFTQEETAPKRSKAKRPMVRRGMEMLVGGIPIQADPPMRSVELFYKTDQSWKETISLSIPDFGPALDKRFQLNSIELALYCEYWTQAALKWNICPARMQTIVQRTVNKRVTDNEPKSHDDTRQVKPRNPIEPEKSEIYMNNKGAFWNYSPDNAFNAPYGCGFRLSDSAAERAKQNQPKVIAIGDVHGCIDELQELLRECDYRVGDLVVFLGDLVCKGPDSVSVVKMAREIGAIGVRGNHDFEVIRWHQAIQSGGDSPAVGSEHFHIASCLNAADMEWMRCLPWYIKSDSLEALFVHAGFVSGVRMAKQNPRLMMNMRSILPDGTVTSKFFNNWPWARLWDGPETVYFGHGTYSLLERKVITHHLML